MKQFLQKKAKLVFLCMLVLLTCTACANPRGRDGKTLADQIIASEETTIDASQINYKDISDKELKKEIKKNIKDGQYTIQPTTFKESMSKGWFEGLIVWPIAQIINLISAKTDAGVGIILTTLLIQVLVFLFTRKSQMSTQRMQEIQPEIQKIQNSVAKKMVTKYQGHYIIAWYGEYILSGKRKYLDFLYQVGIGAKNSQGFGMIEML